MSNHSSSNLLHKSWPSALPKTIIVSSQWQLGACLAPWHGAQNVNIIWHSTPKTWLNTWTYTDINVDKWQSSNHSKCFPVFQVFLTFTSVHPFPASGWSIHKTNSGKKKKPWGNPWDNIVVKPGASSRWNRFPAFGFTRGLAALLVGRVLGRFRYAYQLRPWECVYVGISYYSNYWCWWTGFFFC